jgi:aryl-alcohol dehydrogenase-like predicted oxidoreductase
LSRFALGTVQFGLSYGVANQTGQISRGESKVMLQLAAVNEIDMIDTAIAYGESELCLGEVGTEGFKLVTKLPAVPDDCADISDWVKGQVSASLSRLGVNFVYGLLLHRPEQLIGPHGNDLYHILQELKDNGHVEKVGISIYSPSQLASLTPKYCFDLVQAPFNLIDRRLYSTGWLKRLKDEEVEVHIRSVFLQGLLLMARTDIPSKFEPWSNLWQTWHNWLEDHDDSALRACLAFPLSFPEIDRVIVGADSQSQLLQIVSLANSQTTYEFPDLQCEDENLINPANWSRL